MNYFVCILNANIIILRTKTWGAANFYGKTLERRVSSFRWRTEAILSRVLLQEHCARYFNFLQRCFTLFVLFFLSGCIHWFPWLIIISNSFPRLVLLLLLLFFPIPKAKFALQGKETIVFLVGALAQSEKFPCPLKNFSSGLQP